MDIYQKCPVLENDNFIVRLLEETDVDDLFTVYSDKFALPFFNSDNCNGSNFYNDCGLMRLDVRSDYENTKALYEILSLIVVPYH